MECSIRPETRNPPSGGVTRLVALTRITSAFRVPPCHGRQVGVGITQLLMQDHDNTAGTRRRLIARWMGHLLMAALLRTGRTSGPEKLGHVQSGSSLDESFLYFLTASAMSAQIMACDHLLHNKASLRGGQFDFQSSCPVAPFQGRRDAGSPY
jgi:hypothetical protein